MVRACSEHDYFGIYDKYFKLLKIKQKMDPYKTVSFQSCLVDIYDKYFKLLKIKQKLDSHKTLSVQSCSVDSYDNYFKKFKIKQKNMDILGIIKFQSENA